MKKIFTLFLISFAIAFGQTSTIVVKDGNGASQTVPTLLGTQNNTAALVAKDFATQTTLAAVLSALQSPPTQPVSGTVAVSNFPSTQAVTGTFWQATQPVSIATMPTTPVSGTFWQATQPVSIASMPSTPVTGTFWQTTQPVSLASLPSLVAGSAIIGKVGIDQTTPGTTNLVALAANQSVNVAQVGGVATSTGSGNVDIGTQRVTLNNEEVQDLYFTGQSAQTATVNNIIPATAGANATDVTGFQTGSIQVVSTGTGGTFIFEGSNDNTNFQTIPVFSQLITTGTPIVAAVTPTASQLIYTFPINVRYIRLRIATTITGGSIQAFSTFKRANWTAPTIRIANATAADANVTATIASGTVTTLTTLTTLANGQTAHSSASTGSPVRAGGRVITTLDTTLAQGDASDIAVTTGQQLLTKPFATSENDWQFVGTVTTTTQTAIKAAGAASIRNFVTGITYQNTNATATTLLIQDGNTTILSISCAASMTNPVNLTFPTPLRGTAATAINYTAGTTAANVLLNVQGYQSF